MKKTIIFIFLSIIIFCSSNYKNIVSDYYSYMGNNSYYNWSFSWALWYHNMSLKFRETPEILHNIWNDNFKFWESYSQKEVKKEFYQKALIYYSWSLNISENIKTRENYNYVLSKLEDLEQNNVDKQNNKDQKKSENNKDQEVDDETDHWENKTENNEEWTQWESTWSQKWAKSEDTSQQENQASQENKKLSVSDMKELQNYLEKLKDSQKKNSQFFNKEKQSWIDQNNLFFWNFIDDPFFQDIFNRWWEKDW